MAADGRGSANARAPAARPADQMAGAEESAASALARYYDLDVAGHSDDVALYLALADRLGGPILELGVGTGRLAVPLATAGYRVTGVDNDPHMLERARTAWAAAGAEDANGGTLELLTEDATRLDLGTRFNLVILAFNGLLVLAGRDEQAAVMRVVATHLAPGGRAVVDVWLPTPEDLALYDGRLTMDWLADDETPRRRVAKLTSARYDAATATARVTTFFDVWTAGGGPVRRLEREDVLHLVGAHELTDLAARAGLSIESAAGDHHMNEFGPGSERIVLVCGLL